MGELFMRGGPGWSVQWERDGKLLQEEKFYSRTTTYSFINKLVVGILNTFSARSGGKRTKTWLTGRRKRPKNDRGHFSQIGLLILSL